MTKTPAFALLTILLLSFICGSSEAQKKNQSTPAQKAATEAVRDVRVTNGPVVRSITDTTALINWSTNVSTDTLLHYGTRSDALDEVARAPWGGLTHSIQLRNLTPDTTYYYRIGTSAAQNTEPMSAVASFRTRPTKKTP